MLKEYRICMPMSVDEYKRGQLYMISRHSDEQSEAGEGVEVVTNEECYDDTYGTGRFTEKKIHLNKRLPAWALPFCPNIYLVEKAWNFYPYTITEYSCTWLPRFQIYIETHYEDNNGDYDDTDSHCDGLKYLKVKQRVSRTEFRNREVQQLDIAFDKVPDKHYKLHEDCTKFKSLKTGRGPLQQGWQGTHDPIMCSYKMVDVKFEVWGMQSKVENHVHKVVKDILVLGHRQAFAWIDLWYDMSVDNVREFENDMQSATNTKVRSKSTDMLTRNSQDFKENIDMLMKETTRSDPKEYGLLSAKL